MISATCSKSCAATLCYPHEVIRTRLREEGSKYRTFMQTLKTVYYEESIAGLYRGLLTHLIRQIPVRKKVIISSKKFVVLFFILLQNTAIMMGIYETVVVLLSSHCIPSPSSTVEVTT